MTSTPPPALAPPPAPKGRSYANPFSSPGSGVVLESAADMAVFVYQGAKVDPSRGPISITKATLRDNSSNETVYVVALNGTNIDWSEKYGQPNGMSTNGLAAQNRSNRYLTGARQTMLANIPEGATVILAGHSQGGMIAQQLAADQTIKDTFKVRNTVTFGSPQVGEGRHEGQLQRLVDRHDVVPNASIESGRRGGFGQGDPSQISRNSGAINPWEAHTTSYFQPKIWDKVNALGEEIPKQGKATLTFDEADVTFFRMTPGVRNFWKANYTPDVQEGSTVLAESVLPGEDIRLALTNTVGGELPGSSTFDATLPEQQADSIRTLLAARGLPHEPQVVTAVLDVARLIHSQEGVRAQTSAAAPSVQAAVLKQETTVPAEGVPSRSV